jgi:hypothetical protein
MIPAYKNLFNTLLKLIHMDLLKYTVCPSKKYHRVKSRTDKGAIILPFVMYTSASSDQGQIVS